MCDASLDRLFRVIHQLSYMTHLELAIVPHHLCRYSRIIPVVHLHVKDSAQPDWCSGFLRVILTWH